MITLDKAIEILTDLQGEGPQYPPDDRREAVKLGIEALKRVRDNPIVANHFFRVLLPGETPFIDTSRSEHTIKKLLESPIGREPR